MVRDVRPGQMAPDKAIGGGREGESPFQATKDGKFKKSHMYCYLLSLSLSGISCCVPSL